MKLMQKFNIIEKREKKIIIYLLLLNILIKYKYIKIL